MNARISLPNRRQSALLNFEFGAMRYAMAVGSYAGGGPAEVFIDCVATRTGRSAHTSMMASVCRDAAILISLALQHGVPAETMRNGITRGDVGDPATVIGAVLDELCGGDAPRTEVTS